MLVTSIPSLLYINFAIVWNTTIFSFTTQSQLLMTLRKMPFENIVGKGENAGNQHFLLFTMFSTLSRTKMTVVATLDLSSAIHLNFVYSQNLSSGKGLRTLFSRYLLGVIQTLDFLVIG